MLEQDVLGLHAYLIIDFIRAEPDSVHLADRHVRSEWRREGADRRVHHQTQLEDEVARVDVVVDALNSRGS